MLLEEVVIMEDTSTALIEGISNDIIIVISATILLVVAIIIWYKTSHRNTFIHPNHLHNVETARQHILQSRADGQRTIRPLTDDDRCPICLDNLHFAVETNCGHLFCTTCVMSYYEHGTFVAAMNCPVCRQLVHVLLVNYTHEEEVDDQVETHLRKIRSYNSRFSGEPRPIMDYVYDFPVLVRHMFRNFFSVSGLVLMLRLRIAVYLFILILYVLSPLDIIPESVLGVLGFVDDLAITGVILLYLTVMFRQSLANRNQ